MKLRGNSFRKSAFAPKVAFLRSLKAESRGLKAAEGFTLIELMVVLAIIVLISLVLIVSSQRFNSSILLRSLAYNIGLSIREAQLYGVAVHQSSSPAPCTFGGTSQFCAAYGVHFDVTTPSSFFVYTDLNNNGVYDAGDQIADKFSTNYGFTIDNFCALRGTAVFCWSACPARYQQAPYSCAANAVGRLDITFVRPDPDAKIYANSNTNVQYTSAFVEVKAPGGATRGVTASLTGQIVVTGS